MTNHRKTNMLKWLWGFGFSVCVSNQVMAIEKSLVQPVAEQYPVQVLLEKKDGLRGDVTAKATFHADPMAAPTLLTVDIKCKKDGTIKNIFNKKVCATANQDFDTKTGYLWVAYKGATFNKDGLLTCGEVFHESFSVDKDCHIKRLEKKTKLLDVVEEKEE